MDRFYILFSFSCVWSYANKKALQRGGVNTHTVSYTWFLNNHLGTSAAVSGVTSSGRRQEGFLFRSATQSGNEEEKVLVTAVVTEHS